MEQQKIFINPNADVAGIRPEDVAGGDTFRVTSDTKSPVLTVQERQPRNGGGSFTQYTMNLQNSLGEPKQLRFLFERHLAPLAKVFGADPEAWRGHIIALKGIQVVRGGGQYWDVEIKAVQ
jgi:hypothetical protein